MDGHFLAVGLARLDLLAGLRDGAKDGVVVESIVFCDHFGGLLLEADVVLLNACDGKLECYFRAGCPLRGEQADIATVVPSSFLRTRSTAPEHPPQLIATLNLYVWVDIFGEISVGSGRCRLRLTERTGNEAEGE